MKDLLGKPCWKKSKDASREAWVDLKRTWKTVYDNRPEHVLVMKLMSLLGVVVNPRWDCGYVMHIARDFFVFAN